ncbi:MAG TPA: GFA family protein [Geminicoccaceae bacterium]|nr:GFA family protein [Geminicoccus sp.]HMU51057.1 GFA family protein [Geminicoccaceae bacterium]
MAETHKGACFCGAVEIEATGTPLEIGYCHCNSCRAYSGDPVSAYLLWDAGDVRVTKGAELIGRFNKTGKSDRQFCTRCGGHVVSGHPDLGLTDVRPGIMAGIVFRPSIHLNYAEAVMPMRDGLPKLRDFPAEVGGSGEVMPE